MTASRRPGSDLVVVGNASDDPFAIDVALGMSQTEDIADLISLKTFANSEFCPRFISDEQDFTRIGHKLDGKRVVIVSTSNLWFSRQNLALRNLLIARAAKENGAAAVVLVEPDLYYSAQDRGPRPDLGATGVRRGRADLKKFDGQPFSAKLYAEMLRLAGVDRVVTVHNHSVSVQTTFSTVFSDRFHNLLPTQLYVDYLLTSNIVSHGRDGERLALCAPDEGARAFVREVHAALGLERARCLMLDKQRTGERDVEITLHPESESTVDDLDGLDVVLFDDMVRTGSTVVRSCELLKRGQGRTIFAVSHFYASDEGREKMASASIDEILTLNTIPTILNRDVQGRLRRKMVVLKIELWLARNLCEILGLPPPAVNGLYQVDMSSKHRRSERRIWLPDASPTVAGPGDVKARR